LKIFLDTNIFLDVLFNRDAVLESTKILNSCHQQLFDGYVADITLLNIDYIASKQAKSIREFLQLINQTFKILGADNAIFESALQIDNGDIEDSVQYVCADMAGCSLIVSNDLKFYRGDIEVLQSVEFVKKYL